VQKPLAEEALSNVPVFRSQVQQRHPTTAAKVSSIVKPDGMSSPLPRSVVFEK